MCMCVCSIVFWREFHTNENQLKNESLDDDELRRVHESCMSA